MKGTADYAAVPYIQYGWILVLRNGPDHLRDVSVVGAFQEFRSDRALGIEAQW